MTRQIPVNLGERSYAVSVGVGLLERLGRFVKALPDARRAVVVADSHVADLYGRACLDSLLLAGLQADLVSFPAGEAHKTLETYAKLLDAIFALQPPLDRRAIVVAVGGGVTGDLAGFVAATALRGIRFVQCPTTLLSAVDASVGGKTGVDHPAGKNLIGAFHQPSAVVIDVTTLRTLPDAELASGLAECVKHAVIRDASLLDFLEARRTDVLARDGECLGELIARNVAIKAAVVSADERERGERAELNFGHTVGHAIETLLGYGAISHGAAVSLGMVAACGLAVDRGLLRASDAARVESLLLALGLPVRWKDLDPAALWDLMLRDKKAQAGQVRMILPVRLGEVKIFADLAPEAVAQAVRRLRP